MDKNFKICPKCGHNWETIVDFVLDLDVEVNGYQANFVNPEAGFIMVTHNRKECQTSITISAEVLRRFYYGPTIKDLYIDHETCMMFCLNNNLLEYCDAKCSMSWIRSVLNYLKDHKLPEQLGSVKRKGA